MTSSGCATTKLKGRIDWETPPWLFRLLDDEFAFDVDAAASEDNAKVDRFWTPRDCGLSQSWAGLRVFCNPPYGCQTARWAEKAVRETSAECPAAVLVIPANTETFWWHDIIMGSAHEIRFIRRRIHFLIGGRRVPNGRPVFASAVAVFRTGNRVGPLISTSIRAPAPSQLQDGERVAQSEICSVESRRECV